MATPTIQSVTATTPGILNTTRRLTTTAATTVLTVGTGKTARIATATVANTDSTPRTISISVVPSGATADSTHLVIPSFTVPASGDPQSGGAVSLTDFLGGMMLGDGDSISVTAGTANVLNIAITGAVSS